MRTLSFASLAASATLFAFGIWAQDYDGLYRPDATFAENWSCDAADLGQDGGAVAITGGKVIGVESECILSNPRAVEGDPDATRFDQTCNGEGESWTAEVVISKTRAGVSLEVDGAEPFQWLPCDSTSGAVVTGIVAEAEEVPSVWQVETRPKPFEDGNDFFFHVVGDPKFCRDPDQAVSPSSLRIECAKDAPVVYLRLGSCDATGASDQPVAARYKFDDQPPQSLQIGPLVPGAASAELGLWNAADAGSFIGRIAAARQLTVAYALPGEVAQYTMRFDISGFANHLSDFRAACKGFADTSPAPVVVAVTGEAEQSGPGAEAALALSRDDRREVQRRLTLVDFDTKGIDGAFGPATRAAIRAFQGRNGVLEDGYLTASLLALLKEQSATAYAEWEKEPKPYYGGDGCLRTPNGRIIRGRTLFCDLRAITR